MPNDKGYQPRAAKLGQFVPAGGSAGTIAEPTDREILLQILNELKEINARERLRETAELHNLNHRQAQF